MGRYNRNCNNCNTPYSGQGKYFCSPKCSLSFRSKHMVLIRIEKICLNCNEKFLVRKKDVDHKYCSIKCSVEKRRKNKRLYPAIRGASPIRFRYYSIRPRALKLGVSFCSVNDFISWHNIQEKKCSYCDIPQETWELLFKGHQNKYSLTIDRKDNSFGYTVNNMALACSQCNMVKNDCLSYEEMKEIGLKYLKPKWQEKLKTINSHQEVSLG